ncbi:hypothetical protein [Olivibacter sitiensis]|uniref:hypothetical protein n=1 Tax=Olivibacter sitiensis TaxID=376470 RepID=UPI000400416D|nr:hypothetical protein [Olivibacter sitiensis]
MKKYIIVLITLLGTSLAQAQNNYRETMSAAIAALDSVKSKESLLEKAALFERIADAEPKEWLPLYYAAYANLYANFWSQEEKERDALLDNSLKLVEKGLKLSDNSELLALKGYVEYMKLSIDPPNRLSYMGSSQAALEKAEKLDPQNPRVYLIQGQNLYYTPAAFGGGKEAATVLLEKAKEKFDTFEPKDELAPQWGRKELQRLLAQ